MTPERKEMYLGLNWGKHVKGAAIIRFTPDELIALSSALDGLDTPVVPDLEVYEAARQKILAAELAAR